MGILIQNGRVLDAASKTDGQMDLYVEGKTVRTIAAHIEPGQNDKVIDASGCIVMPGIVDLHVHLRDPGQTEKEDLESGSRAAARGGVTSLVAMPNTRPVIDSPDRASYVLNKAAQLSPVHIYQAGAMTKGELGHELSDIEGMALSGVKALSEDGKSVMDASLCRKAFQEAARLGLPVFDHCEDLSLRGDGVMNDDEKARELGLPGISNSVEDVIAARDILLAMETGTRLHLCHCSTKGVALMMKTVRELGIDSVSAEVCPHHFALCTEDIPSDDPNYKMNPPLRRREDMMALREGLRCGLFSVISTDHAPHTARDKGVSMRDSAFGIVGLETSLALTWTVLVREGILTPLQMVEKMCLNPARILGIQAGVLKEGAPADITIADVGTPYRIDPSRFVSKGKNTPFGGREVYGKVRYTLCDGHIIFELRE